MKIEEVELGQAKVLSPISNAKMTEIKNVLQQNGFELIGDKKSQQIAKIKTIIIEKIHHSEKAFDSINSSDYIAKEMGLDYSYLSHLFSSVEV
ncbi:hypothetical protein [Saccharicrinis fermentans]|uniref:hypothetical protein n=1 Tax=Saccharicrinis fermentans TaxID=982 RepID=UPI001F39BED0|nr:hypothetical protein [Saccharicrinis fermentans]